MRQDDFVESLDLYAVDRHGAVRNIFASLTLGFVNRRIDKPVYDILFFVRYVDRRHLAKGLGQFVLRQIGNAAVIEGSFKASGLWTKVVTSSAKRR